MSMIRSCLAGVFVLLLAGSAALAQDKKDEKSDAPRITALSPLAIKTGETTTVRLRGMKLEKATAVKMVVPDVSLKLTLMKAAAADGGKDDKSKGFGDTVVELDVRVPDVHFGGEVELFVVTPDSQTAPVKLAIVKAERLIDEVEPNGGFRKAQAVPERCLIRGVIGEEKDVDVYRVSGRAGQMLSVQLKAAGIASVLDASLTLYNARGQILKTVDDLPPSRDPALEYKLPEDGDYFFAVTDSHDRGSPTTHPYLVQVDLK
jgi:hypothetical protein